jgi:hypothetical protein
MTQADYQLIVGSVCRSRMAKSLDKNRVRRQAMQSAIELVAIDLAASLAHVDPSFDRDKFLADCGFTTRFP